MVSAVAAVGIVVVLVQLPADRTAPRPTLREMIATGHRLVAFTENAHNAAAFLRGRVDRCTRARGRSPTIIAVDFATLGQAQNVVDELNRERSRSG